MNLFYKAMRHKIVAIVLAAGKGTRINSQKINKAAYPFLGQPMILYAVKLLENICDKTIVVVGAFAQSIKSALESQDVLYVYQKKRLGTGHAAKVGVQVAGQYSPTLVLVGYGDHMMFYKKKTIKSLIKMHQEEKAAVSLITTNYEKPNELAWGRIIRNNDGFIVDIIEQKDTDEKQRKISEVNPGFYCFDFQFLLKNIDKLKKSEKTHEYYLTDMVKIAFKQGKKVVGLKVPFEEVGIGVNKYEELVKSQKLYSKTH